MSIMKPVMIVCTIFLLIVGVITVLFPKLLWIPAAVAIGIIVLASIFKIGNLLTHCFWKMRCYIQDTILNRNRVVIRALTNKTGKKPLLLYSGLIPNENMKYPNLLETLLSLSPEYTLLQDLHFDSSRLNGRDLKVDYILVSKYGVVIVEVRKKDERKIIQLTCDEMKSVRHCEASSKIIREFLSCELNMFIQTLSLLIYDRKIIFTHKFESGKRGDLFVIDENSIAAPSYLLMDILSGYKNIKYDNQTVFKILDVLKSNAK